MSFDEAWGQARSAAAARQTSNMQLNQAAASGGGGGSSDYKVTSPDLKAIGNEAQELFHLFEVDAFHAGAESHMAANKLNEDGFKTGAAMWSAWDTWRSQAEALLSACAHIHNHLEDTVVGHRNYEESLAANHSIAKLSEHFK